VNRIAIFALATLAAFSLAATSCQRDDDAPARAGRSFVVEPRAANGGGKGPAFDAAMVNSPAPETQTPAAKDAGRFAGAFEFYRYEILHINNMESPLDAREMAGARIVVEMGGDGRLRIAQIGGMARNSHVIREVTRDDFSFLVGNGSMLIWSSVADGHGSSASWYLRYDDEDTIVYEVHSFLRIFRINEDFDEERDEPLDRWEWLGEQEIRFRLIYKRIRSVAVPTTVAVRVNGREFSAPAWEVDGRRFFGINDIAYMLVGTRARFSVRPVRSYERFDFLQRGAPSPAGWETGGADRAVTLATVARETGIVFGGINMIHVARRHFIVELGFDVASIDGGSYFPLFDLGAALGFGASRDSGSGAILIDTMERTISDRGRAAAQEFLSGFPWQAPTRDEVAIEYRIFDFNNDGIPEIAIRWGLSEAAWIPRTTLHAYVSGEYIEVGSFGDLDFYACDQGRIYIVDDFIWWHTPGDTTLYEVAFDGSGTMRLDRIAGMHFVDDGNWDWQGGRREGMVKVRIEAEGATRVIPIEEYAAMLRDGNFETLRGDFPGFASFMERQGSIFRLAPLGSVRR